MAILALTAAAVVVFPQSLAAEPPPMVPERLFVAEYVALGIDLGGRIVAAEALLGDAWRATPREREALEEIRHRLESWDRCVVVSRLAEAELLLVVRQGRRGSIGGGGGTGAASRPSQGAASRPRGRSPRATTCSPSTTRADRRARRCGECWRPTG